MDILSIETYNPWMLSPLDGVKTSPNQVFQHACWTFFWAYWSFCLMGRFVSRAVLSQLTFCQLDFFYSRTFCLPDVLSSGRFVCQTFYRLDVWYLRTIWPLRPFCQPDVVFMSDVLTFCQPDVLYRWTFCQPDILYLRMFCPPAVGWPDVFCY